MLDWMLDFLLNFSEPFIYTSLFGILLLCGLGLPVPEDITLALAGFLVYLSVLNLWVVIVIAYLGIIIGDSIIFLLGATLGRALTQVMFFKSLLPEKRLADARRQFNQRGNRLIFMARFMPGLRAPIYFSAGMLHVPYRVFLFYDGIAALISVPVIISVVYYFGDQLAYVLKMIRHVEHGIFILIACAILVVLVKWYLGRKKLKTN